MPLAKRHVQDSTPRRRAIGRFASERRQLDTFSTFNVMHVFAPCGISSAAWDRVARASAPVGKSKAAAQQPADARIITDTCQIFRAWYCEA
jgi:hypothetical protein